MLQTRLTALLGIRYPIISAPMARMSGGHLAAAVRVHNNPFIQSWHGRESELRARLDEVLPAYAEALQRGDRDIVPLLFGQSTDFVHAVRPAADALRELCETAEHCLRTRLDNLIQ
jgi:nitronate monooxygenase